MRLLRGGTSLARLNSCNRYNNCMPECGLIDDMEGWLVGVETGETEIRGYLGRLGRI